MEVSPAFFISDAEVGSERAFDSTPFVVITATVTAMPLVPAAIYRGKQRASK